MASQETLVRPRPAPELGIPDGATVTVRVIDSTTNLFLQDQILMIQPKIQEDNSINIPSYSFLISNGEHHVLFDLGVRKDPENFAPAQRDRIFNKLKFDVHVEKNVAEILDEHVGKVGIRRKDVEAVIWSHHHWDHVGDIGGTFPKSTSLVVGPGFKKKYTPGYPIDPESGLFESDWEGRTFREIDIAKEGKGLKIGRFGAYDYFGDGSFYLLDSPGHTVGHMCGLARVSSSPDSFVLMGGDASHNIGELRPTQYLPLPKTIHPSPLARLAKGGCPGELVQAIHPKKSASEPIYVPSPGFNLDGDEAERTIEKLTELDASAGVLVILAHDKALHPELPYFPESINDWFARDLDVRTRWCFLKPLGEAIEAAAA